MTSTEDSDVVAADTVERDYVAVVVVIGDAAMVLLLR